MRHSHFRWVWEIGYLVFDRRVSMKYTADNGLIFWVGVTINNNILKIRFELFVAVLSHTVK